MRCGLVETGGEYHVSEPKFRIRAVNETDRAWMISLLTEQWGSPLSVSRGHCHDAAALPGFLAERGTERLGLVTYHLVDRDCEVVTLNSLAERVGIGAALLEAVRDRAIDAGAERIWLITTNDNVTALEFYQKRGFVLAHLHRDAMKASRRLKPQIPLVAENGIPIRDELELEMKLEHAHQHRD
jgi:GNAT superfamily N-acetyltransferase